MAEKLIDLGLDDRPVESIDKTNYAKNKKITERFTKDVVNQFQAIRTQRRTLTNKFLEWQALWQGVHTQRLYKGRSDIFVPRAQKVVETHVTNTVMRAFPINEKYEIRPRVGDPLSEARADLTEQVLDHLLEESKIRAKMHHFVRMAYMLGTSVMKSPWVVDKTKQYRRRAVLGPEDTEARLQPGQPSTFVDSAEIIQFEGVKPKVVDLLRWFIHPVTSEDIDDYEIIFEENDIDVNHLHTMKKQKKYVNVDEAIRRHGDGKLLAQSEVDGDRLIRQAAYGLVPSDAGIKSHQLKLTEVYVKFPLYLEQGVDNLVPCRAVVLEASGGGEPLVLSLTQNPFFDQRPPYRAWKVRDQTDTFYGQGLLETLEAMQYALNAFMNQGIDVAQFVVSPMVIMDMLKFNHRGGDINIAPLGVLGVRGKPRDAVDFWSPPDTSQVAIQVASFLGALMEDEGGAVPLAQGKSASGTQSATESQILATASQAFQASAIRKLEMEVLTPMLRDWYLKAEQFLSEETFMRVTNSQPTDQPVQHLVGDYDLQWRVSTAAEQKEALVLDQMQMDLLLKEIQAQIAILTGGQVGSQPKMAPQAGANGPAPGPSGATPTSPANRPFTAPEGTI
jgi:hypothetical protein